MKNLFFTLITMTALSSNAQILHFCDQTVQDHASAAFVVDFPNEVITKVDSTATHYVGFHTKMYTANVVSAAVTATYEVQVFEFETEDTDCSVDLVKKIN